MQTQTISDTPILAQPFLKWAGGKTQLLPELTKRLPPDLGRGRYFEPFLGGGALFFALRPARAWISDINDHLVTVYTAVKNHLGDVMARLGQLREEYQHDKKLSYYGARTRFNAEKLDDTERAALFIYLNKTCFNGLFRVNRKGEFNVPIGSYKNPAILQPDKLAAASAALQSADIRKRDFRAATNEAELGDFVYFDPPYMPVSKTSNFTAFAADGFDDFSQSVLADRVTELAARGVRCMVSSSDHPIIRTLYAKHRISTVSARRSINSNANKRGTVNELIITAGY